MDKLQLAIDALDKEHENYKKLLIERYSANSEKVDTMFKELPEWAQHLIDKAAEGKPTFLLMGYFEFVFAATEGVALGQQFNSVTAWESFLQDPSKSLVQPRLAPEHTEQTFQLMINFANEYVRRNNAKVIIAQ